MDFFTAQDAARRKTRLLIFLFGLAILVLVVLTNVFLMVASGMLSADSYDPGNQAVGTLAAMQANFSWSQFFAIGVAVVVVIFAGSAFRLMSLRGGGKTVAESLGGRLITGNTNDKLERRLINVVEEIAIASGTPVPLVFVMDEEPGINAFAAGQSTGDAVVAVTRGTLELLSRSELQGVIAHEFSHILNGDMRINLRLVGILFGILMLGIIGKFMLRSAMFSSIGRSRKESNGAVLIAIGLGLFILGYAGIFFGNMIKAAVSRQREFLADASAVQFTRDPDGIAGALMKIGGSVEGSKMRAPDAEEFSHAYFGEGLSHMFGLLSTHPPLPDRIRRMRPDWDGKFVIPEPVTPEYEPQTVDRGMHKAENIATGAMILGGVLEAIGRTGQATDASIDNASDMLASLPASLTAAAHEPYGARAVIYALLLDQQQTLRDKQLEHLHKHSDVGVADLTERVWPALQNIDANSRLGIVDLALPALRQLSEGQYQLFRDNLQKLIDFDNQVSVFEWSLQKIVLQYLYADFEKKPLTSGRMKSLQSLTAEATVLLSFLVGQTQLNEDDAQRAYSEALVTLGISDRTMLSRQSLPDLDVALKQLARLKPLEKPQLLKACASAILADEQVTADEAELLRAFSAILECPMPPLVL